jgi:hypothetical protein
MLRRSPMLFLIVGAFPPCGGRAVALRVTHPGTLEPCVAPRDGRTPEGRLAGAPFRARGRGRSKLVTPAVARGTVERD